MARLRAANDRSEAAAVLRRLTELHHTQDLTLAGYRYERRRLLEAIAAGRAIPADLIEASLAAETRWVLGVLIAAAAVAALGLILWLT